MMNGNNTIETYGTIQSELSFSHEMYGEGLWCFDVKVSRLSGQADILPVTVSERIIEREKMTVGIQIHISGQIRSYNTYSEDEKRNKLVLTIFARETIIQNTVLDASLNNVSLNGFLCKPTILSHNSIWA